MGCISCKAITRSLSVREEVSHGFGGKSSAWDELLTSNGGNDHLFALLCSSNSVSKKLKTSGFTLPSKDPGDPIEDVDVKADEFTRSKSCQISGEKDVLCLSAEINGNKNAIGSRSFHTVEEYDALLERIHRSRTASAESFEDYYSSNSIDGNQESGEDYARKKSIIEEELDLDIDSKDVIGSPENGWKRKAVARGLKSLDVEFPRLKQQIHNEGRVHSPGAYVTPKFGSYNTDATQEKARFSGQDAMFSPELVAAFEDHMMELQVEEDSILRELDGYLIGDEMETKVL